MRIMSSLIGNDNFYQKGKKMKICYNSFLLLYDCRNYKGDYLGRRIVLLDLLDDDPEDSSFQRSILDSDSVLVHTVTWDYKVVNISLVADYMEYDYDA